MVGVATVMRQTGDKADIGVQRGQRCSSHFQMCRVCWVVVSKL